MRILFMGTSDFAVPSLEALRLAGYPVTLVVTQSDKPAGRGMELKSSPVKLKAAELGLPVYQPEKVRTPEAIEALQKAEPDVAVVAAYGQILPAAVLQIPKIACLNIHGSILPKYRGAAPIHYAVMNGETETGVTIMYMNEKMDEGDMLLVKTTPIGPEETTGEIHDRLAKLGSQGLLEALKLLAEGKAPRTPQDHSKATYAPSIKREFCKLDWNSTATRIHNRVRGLSPWPGAETGWQGMELKVHKAQLASLKGKPGEVLEVSKEGVVVGAAVDSVQLIEIQPPGKKKMSAYDFTLGHPDFKKGEILS
ncbi:MAG TPA: methionyl-tRNA formyltransferase [bacterium]|nr:methionyl-tRNA formyltransferase [bacterium]